MTDNIGNPSVEVKDKKRFYRGRWVMLIFLLICLIYPPIDLMQDRTLAQQASYCPSKLIAGIPCVGCGSYKGIAHLGLGEVRQALKYHSLIFIIYIGIVLLIVQYGLELLKGKYVSLKLLNNPTINSFLLGVVVMFQAKRLFVFFTSGSALEEIKQSVVGGIIFSLFG